MTTTTPWRAVKGHKYARHSVSLETNGTDYRITTGIYLGEHEPIQLITKQTTEPILAMRIYKTERRFIRTACPYELADALL
jgi:hypothetical protein